MTAEQIVNLVATNPEYKKICTTIAKGNDLADDLFQELIIILIQYDKAKLEQVYKSGGLKFFIIRILQNQYKSDSSDFHRKHRRFNQASVELTGIEVWDNEETKDQYYSYIVEYEQSREVHEDSADWYANSLFKGFIREGGYRKLERKTGISRTAITTTLTEVFNKIKEKSEQMKNFMEAEKIPVPIPSDLRRDIFTASLYRDLTIEEVLIQRLKMASKRRIVQKKTENQLRLF